MKIHSKYRDYYDLGLTYGLDPNLHYVRKERSFSLDDVKTKIPGDIKDAIGRGSTSFQKRELKKFAVGFCGTIYPGIIVYTYTGKVTAEGREEQAKEFVYSPDRLKEIFPTQTKLGKRERRRRHLYEQFPRLFGSDRTTEQLCEYLTPRTGYDKLFIELSSQYKEEYIAAPSFVFGIGEQYRYNGLWENVYMNINSPLEKYNFAKVKDPFTAFQEISMYLGNQLTHVEEPIQISDKDMLVEKGFDIKTSFRHPVKLSQL